MIRRVALCLALAAAVVKADSPHLAFEGTQAYLGVLESLLDHGHVASVRDALTRWDRPLGVPDHEARLMTLRGRIALSDGQVPSALRDARAAAVVAKGDAARRAARLLEATALARQPSTRLRGLAIAEHLRAGEDAVAAEAHWCLASRDDLPIAQQMRMLTAFLAERDGARHRVDAHLALAKLHAAQTRPGDPAALEHLLAAQTSALGDTEALTRVHRVLQQQIGQLRDVSALEVLRKALLTRDPQWASDPALPELRYLLSARIVTLTRDARASTALDHMDAETQLLLKRTDARHSRWRRLAARAALMRAELAVMRGEDASALAALEQAAYAYAEGVRHGDPESGETLLRIGGMLAARGRFAAAVTHLETVHRALADHAVGAQALWALAELQRDLLDQPLAALQTWLRYHDRFPPSYRAPASARDRIQRLGYPDVSAFQARHGLQVDGIVGSRTLSRLREEEAAFGEILPAVATRQPVRGRAVADVLYALGTDLCARGRYREAVRVYQAFLDLFPGNRLADDALFQIAGLFKAHDLHNEAVVAYARMRDAYPDGDQTSHAYLEAAHCCECLGRWEEAEQLYRMFVAKFPRYRRADEARRKLAAMRKVRQFAGLLQESELDDARTADARYEMGRLLYKENGNARKAAEIFADVAERYPDSFHAPEALYTAGTCELHEQNYERARAVMQRLVDRYPDSRLADDALYWIGHSYEYQARALGELDEARIVIQRRSLRQASRLRADLAIRQQYWPEAAPGERAWHEPHPDLLRGGNQEARVQRGLREAIAAYEKVAEAYRMGDMTQKALLRIGEIHRKYLDDPDRAFDAYRRLLERFPGSHAAVDAQIAVGRHYLAKGRYAEAEQAIRQFLSAFPGHARAPEALLDLADCHRRQREWMKALDDYESYLARYPQGDRVASVKEEIAWIKQYRLR